MSNRKTTLLVLVASLALLGCAVAIAADKPAVDKAAVDKAFEALKTYDWGKDQGAVQPIDDAIIATHGDDAARKELEARLAPVLKTDVSRAAKDYVCRKLMVIGSAECVPTVAGLLTDKDLSHMARYALERIPAPQAAQALRDALPKSSGVLKVGVVNSLGARRDVESVAPLAALLGDSDKAVAGAAVSALGRIGTADAANALGELAKKAPDELKLPVADALLACAERLLADDKKAEATQIYKSLSGPDQPKQVRLAATRGLLGAAGK